MENVTELNFLDEKFDFKYINWISSEPTRAPELVRSIFVLFAQFVKFEHGRKIYPKIGTR